MQRGKNSIFAISIENIFKVVRDRAISSEFLTHRVVQQYSVPRGKISVFTTFGCHLGFQRKMKNCEYLAKGISSPVMLGGRYIPRQWSCYAMKFNFLQNQLYLHVYCNFKAAGVPRSGN